MSIVVTLNNLWLEKIGNSKTTPYSPSHCDLSFRGDGHKFSVVDFFSGTKTPPQNFKNEGILGRMMKCFYPVRYKVTE